MIARSSRLLAAVLVLALFVAACGGGNQPSSVTWRNVEIDLPDGWYVFEEEATRLSISNQDIGPEAVFGASDLEGDVVAMFLTYEPGTQPNDWRRFVEEQGAELESDDQIVLDGEVPATRLVFRYETDGIPLREMVVVIPSRAIVVLAQPVPAPGDTDAPEVFLRYIDTFIEVLETARFGAPLMD
jgi:hypothetical protein